MKLVAQASDQRRSNARFDAMLRSRDPASGVRNFNDVLVFQKTL
jgi:hypothetical protein